MHKLRKGLAGLELGGKINIDVCRLFIVCASATHGGAAKDVLTSNPFNINWLFRSSATTARVRFW